MWLWYDAVKLEASSSIVIPWVLDCENGDVKLVGGSSNNEGTVQVCFDHLWGLISESGWNQKDAEVVCRELGYNPEGKKQALI